MRMHTPFKIDYRRLGIGLLLLIPLPGPALTESVDFLEQQAIAALSQADTPFAFRDAARLLVDADRQAPPDATRYYNLGLALLMAEHPEAALTVLRRAERWGGNIPGLRRNLALAHAQHHLGAPELPWYRWPLRAHYTVGLPTRESIFWIVWTLVWIGLALKGTRASHPGLRRIGRRLTTVAVTLALLSGLSVGVSHVAEGRDRREWPGLFEKLLTPTRNQPAEEPRP